MVCAVVFAGLSSACDKEPAAGGEPLTEAGHTPRPEETAGAPSAQPEARAPDIIVDRSRVAIGPDRVPAEERALADKITVFLTGRPAVEGRSVDFVAMRDAKPSGVAAIVTALRRAKATGAKVKTEARDGTTQSVPLAFATSIQDCTTIAWIAKDDAIDVWPAGGGRAKRVIKGLAGPDMTLGTEAVRTRQSGCGASQLIVGADDAISWGLVFDLTSSALHAPGASASSVVLVTSAVPGRKLVLE
jgi:hypothetical protein